jgi:MFS family permease
MIGLAIVFLVSARTGSYALAGALSAMFAVLWAVGAPVLARLVDRHGQRRVGLPAVATHAAGLVVFLTLVAAGAPRWSWFVAVTVGAVAEPSFASMVLARWTFALGPGSARLHTAYALDSVLDEVVFVTGPPLVALLASQVWDGAGVVAAAVLGFVGGVWLLAQRGTEPPPQPETRSGAWVIHARGLPTIVLVMFWLGAIFGAMEVTAVAFADEHGHRGVAGIVLALYAVGSMIGGLVYGLVRWRSSAPVRFAVGTAVMAVTLLPLPFLTSLGPLYPLALIAGMSIAPTMVAFVSLIERLVPGGQFNEGLAWAISSLAAGMAVGAASAGAIADRFDARWGFAVSAVAGLVAAATCVLGIRAMTPNPRQSSRERGQMTISEVGE